jgi:hypothetical protein
MILKRLEMAKSFVSTSSNQLKVPTKDLQVRNKYNLHFKVQENSAVHRHGRYFTMLTKIRLLRKQFAKSD